jgi:hypothetical protein
MICSSRLLQTSQTFCGGVRRVFVVDRLLVIGVRCRCCRSGRGVSRRRLLVDLLAIGFRRLCYGARCRRCLVVLRRRRRRRLGHLRRFDDLAFVFARRFELLLLFFVLVLVRILVARRCIVLLFGVFWWHQCKKRAFNFQTKNNARFARGGESHQW